VRRRLLLVIAGAVAAAVTVVGLGTLLLTQLDARHRDEDELERRVTALAAVVSEVRPTRVQGITRRLQPALDADAVLGLDLHTVWDDAPAAEVPPEITELVREREAARAAKDYARADALRDEIGAAGFDVIDRKDDSTVRRR